MPIYISALDWLVDFINDFWDSLKSLVIDALKWLAGSLRNAILWLIDTIYDAILWLLESIYYLLIFVIEGTLTVLKVVFVWMFDGLLTLVYLFVDSLDFSGILVETFGAWGLLSPQAIYVINQCGIPQGLTLLAYAIGIRVMLNLLPAAVTRV